VRRERDDRSQPAPGRDRRALHAAASAFGAALDRGLRALWRLAQKLEAVRGKTDPRIDYNFYVDWDATPDGRIDIVPRPRGSPLDKLVAELMIHVNEKWGALLADVGVPGLYRTQQQGRYG
jgi:exoribonuclease-2